MFTRTLERKLDNPVKNYKRIIRSLITSDKGDYWDEADFMYSFSQKQWQKQRIKIRINSMNEFVEDLEKNNLIKIAV